MHHARHSHARDRSRSTHAHKQGDAESRSAQCSHGLTDARRTRANRRHCRRRCCGHDRRLRQRAWHRSSAARSTNSEERERVDRAFIDDASDYADNRGLTRTGQPLVFTTLHRDNQCRPLARSSSCTLGVEQAPAAPSSTAHSTTPPTTPTTAASTAPANSSFTPSGTAAQQRCVQAAGEIIQLHHWSEANSRRVRLEVMVLNDFTAKMASGAGITSALRANSS